MECSKLVVFVVYFSIAVSTKLICLGFSADGSAAEYQYIHQHTESPFDQEETTTKRFKYNVTLDVLNDTFTRDWRTSPGNVKNWFEYYNDTNNLLKAKSEEAAKTCAEIIRTSESIKLSEVEGIWVACQDPLLPKDCSMSSSISAACHPFITYSFGSHVPVFRTVKIHLYVSGLAIVRLKIGSTTIDDSGRCFDFSLRRDPFSSCEYIKVEKNSLTGWTEVKSNFDGYNSISFNSFSVQLIARFEDDVALIDKVEATDFLLCGQDDAECSTTTPGPTNTASTRFFSTTPTTTTTTPGDITDPVDDGSSTTIKGTETPPNVAASLYVPPVLLLSLLACFKVYNDVIALPSV